MKRFRRPAFALAAALSLLAAAADRALYVNLLGRHLARETGGEVWAAAYPPGGSEDRAFREEVRQGAPPMIASPPQTGGGAPELVEAVEVRHRPLQVRACLVLELGARSKELGARSPSGFRAGTITPTAPPPPPPGRPPSSIRPHHRIAPPLSNSYTAPLRRSRRDRPRPRLLLRRSSPFTGVRPGLRPRWARP